MATEVLPDAYELRSGRRERALAQMDAHGLDILVLGRQANIRYVTGAPQLWIAGTRPFGPICALVRASETSTSIARGTRVFRRRSGTITSTDWPGTR